MDIHKEREVFEAWVGSNGRSIERFSDGSYKSMTLDKEWEAWQAAKAQAVPEWINVNLLSPQIDTEVLVCIDDDVKTAIYRDLDGEGYFEGIFGAKWWMPKPKAQEPAND